MSTALEQLQYGFDRDSRRIWRQRATTQGWDNAYVYDSLSQVIGDDRGDLNLARNAIAGVPAKGSRWQYDETGNWHGYQNLESGATALTQSRTHDKGNRLMEVSDAAAMRTDRAGRMLETVAGPNGDWSKGYKITWDAWSRIVGVASVEGEAYTPVATYGYDGLTRRVTRYTNAEDVTLHSYYNDEWRPVEERKGSETTAAASYLWGSRHRDDLVRRDRAVGGTTLNETRCVLMDYFSPAAITDESGSVTERYAFSAFGLRAILNADYTVRNDSECAMEFAFQGQFEDIETSWMNYGYRYYLPWLGRWGCKDPIGELGSYNLYATSDNQAVNQVDFLGLVPDKDCKWKISMGHLIGPDQGMEEAKEWLENQPKGGYPGSSCGDNKIGFASCGSDYLNSLIPEQNQIPLSKDPGAPINDERVAKEAKRLGLPPPKKPIKLRDPNIAHDTIQMELAAAEARKQLTRKNNCCKTITITPHCSPDIKSKYEKQASEYGIKSPCSPVTVPP